MQLLLEEFFKKVNSLSKGNTSFTLSFIVKFMFFVIAVTFIGFIAYFIYTKNYLIILIILGAIIIGETAHYIRKSREKVIQDQMPKKASKENAKDILKDSKTKNKGLLKDSSKNNGLLDSTTKNKNLLGKKKVKAVDVKK